MYGMASTYLRDALELSPGSGAVVVRLGFRSLNVIGPGWKTRRQYNCPYKRELKETHRPLNLYVSGWLNFGSGTSTTHPMEYAPGYPRYTGPGSKSSGIWPLNACEH
jgi:hypothetical protein